MCILAGAMSTLDEYQDLVRRHLDARTPKIDDALAAIASDDREAAIQFLLFEYDSPEFDRDFPIPTACRLWPGVPERSKPIRQGAVVASCSPRGWRDIY